MIICGGRIKERMKRLICKNCGQKETLEKLRQLDEAQRTCWVEQHRSTKFSLGTVVKETATKRQSLWVVSQKPYGGQTSSGHQASPKRGGGSGHQKSSKGSEWYGTHMKNGESICMQWNKNLCNKNEKACGKRHVCNAIIKGSGRVCGMANHQSCQHRWKP